MHLLLPSRPPPSTLRVRPCASWRVSLYMLAASCRSVFCVRAQQRHDSSGFYKTVDERTEPTTNESSGREPPAAAESTQPTADRLDVARPAAARRAALPSCQLNLCVYKLYETALQQHKRALSFSSRRWGNGLA
jgi:hypothetical protein